MACILVGAVSGWAAALAETDDFPDDCSGYATAHVGEPVHGALHPPDDDADHFGLQINASHVGHRINVTYVADTHHTNIDVYTPDCQQNVVPVPHQACTKAKCPPGHDNDRGKGHELCMGQGHVSECTGSEGGESGEDYVSFVPTQEGVYVVVVTVDPHTYRCTGNDCRFDDPKDPGDDDACLNCVDSGTQSTDDGATIQTCHYSCEGDSLSFEVVSTDEDATLVR